MSGDVRKALKDKGFSERPPFPRPGGMPAPIGRPDKTGIDSLKEELLRANREEKTAGAEYMNLAAKAERLGLLETADKLREIAQAEMQHHKILSETLDRWNYIVQPLQSHWTG